MVELINSKQPILNQKKILLNFAVILHDASQMVWILIL